MLRAVALCCTAAVLFAPAPGWTQTPPSARDLAAQGNAAYDKGDYKTALTRYDEAIRLDPNRAGFYVGRGKAQDRLKHFDRAIADFTVALRLDPRNAEALWRRAVSNHRTGEDSTCIALLADSTEAIRLDPSCAGAYQARGTARATTQQFDLALADYTEAIRLDSNSAKCFANRAAAYQFTGVYDRALADYTEAIRLDPKYAWAYLCRAALYAEKREFAKALADLNESIRLDPKHSNGYYNRGVVYLSMDELDRAIADLTQALYLPEDEDTAVLCSRWVPVEPSTHEPPARGSLHSGTDYFLSSIYHSRGSAYLAKGDYDRALRDCNQAVSRQPTNPFFRATRGVCSMSMGHYSGALADLKEAVRIDPTFVYALRALAWLQAACPDPEVRDGMSAMSAARNACELTQGKDVRCLECLAAACAEAGSFSDAVQWQKKALEALGTASPAEAEEMRARLKLYEQGKPYHEK
jgi:tetratricopeptide (TPR) repeat protein